MTDSDFPLSSDTFPSSLSLQSYVTNPSPPPSLTPSWMDTSSSPPTASPPPTMTSLPGAHFIDSIVQRLNLNAVHKSHLQGLYQLATSLEGHLTPADLISRVYALACQFSMELRILEVVQGGGTGIGNAGGQELKTILDELAIRLDTTFQLTNEQTKTIRHVCQEQIYKPWRVSYKSLHHDIMKILRSKATYFRMDNIFGQPTREAKWATDGKKIASGVRNAFCQDLRDSVIGSSQTSLANFTMNCLEKYKQSNVSSTSGSTANSAYLAHVAILRRFAVKNKHLLTNKVSEEEEDNSSDGTSGPQSPKRKRVTVARKGRIPNGVDFWAQVDAWFKIEMSRRGKDFSSDAWKSYIDESIAQDNARYNAFIRARTPSLVIGSGSQNSVWDSRSQSPASSFPTSSLSLPGASSAPLSSHDQMLAPPPNVPTMSNFIQQLTQSHSRA